MKKYHRGIYRVVNKEKYVGNVDSVIYRSGLELRFFKLFDSRQCFIRWSSEEIVIPYLYSVDNRIHMYYPDCMIEYINQDGLIKKAIVEIKPSSDMKQPKIGKRVTRGFINKNYEYIKNRDKWKYAREYCENNNILFIILTEKDLLRYK